MTDEAICCIELLKCCAWPVSSSPSVLTSLGSTPDAVGAYRNKVPGAETNVLAQSAARPFGRTLAASPFGNCSLPHHGGRDKREVPVTSWWQGQEKFPATSRIRRDEPQTVPYPFTTSEGPPQPPGCRDKAKIPATSRVRGDVR